MLANRLDALAQDFDQIGKSFEIQRRLLSRPSLVLQDELECIVNAVSRNAQELNCRLKAIRSGCY